MQRPRYIRTLRALLKILPRKGWYLDLDGAIRRRVGGFEHCPVTLATLLVTRRRWHPWECDKAARTIGMPADLAWDVALAADTVRTPPHVSLRVHRIRGRLLRHLFSWSGKQRTGRVPCHSCRSLR